jgi:polyhydroxybutyrate depolymerase
MKTLRWWRGVTLLAALALPGCGSSPVMASYEGEDWEDSFMQADYTRFFRVHVPERPELGPAAPLVLAFHGSGQTGDQLRTMSGLDQAADSAGFIVVYLEAAQGAWDIFGALQFLGLDELGYVREVIERVERRSVIDRSRIIAVGISNGGVMSQQLGCKLADRLAGFVAVAASLPKIMANECAPSRPVSARYILGTEDTFFPVGGSSVLLSVDGTMEAWAAINGCSGTRARAVRPDLVADGTVVYQSMYAPCRGGTRVELDSIVGGGHTWPGAANPGGGGLGLTSSDISANTEIARFLATIPRD